MPITLLQLTQALPATSALIAPFEAWPAVVSQVQKQVHPADFWYYPEEESLSIAKVRELQHFMLLSPVGSQKVAILSGVDSFKAETANALLKLLEEPPAYASFILLSETDHFLPTVRSRVQAFVIKEVNNQKNAWQKLLSQYNLQDNRQRYLAKQLLYLQSLAHSGIKEETILEPYIQQRVI